MTSSTSPQSEGQQRRLHRIIAAVVGITVSGLLLTAHLLGRAPQVDPVIETLRVSQTDLESLPVQFDDVMTCGCWDGPRGQAQKKYSFRITNTGQSQLDIGGGVESNLRLLVSYPASFDPVGTVPGEGRSMPREVAVPPDVPVLWATEIRETRPTALLGGEELFHVRPGWRLYAIPPNENQLVEDTSDPTNLNVASFPTYVSDESLGPGESFHDERYGLGDWVFYVPLPGEIADLFPDGLEAVMGLERRTVNKHLAVIGVAVIDPSAEEGQVIGFSPTPTESMLSSPEDF